MVVWYTSLARLRAGYLTKAIIRCTASKQWAVNSICRNVEHKCTNAIPDCEKNYEEAMKNMPQEMFFVHGHTVANLTVSSTKMGRTLSEISGGPFPFSHFNQPDPPPLDRYPISFHEADAPLVREDACVHKRDIHGKSKRRTREQFYLDMIAPANVKAPNNEILIKNPPTLPQRALRTGPCLRRIMEQRKH
ncbi:hypothetical protein EVAR_20416_1 [Eumeta japonica]|uniref:Uncharacterized protein n=1 Tax=Eumeta variegata TaxID=151549 RepID=A0A4C1TXW0_EUMVA|nr:hypothetical protein EVAR_20416_1 [Eumeta japonica]